jgi:2'-5' RNA ligase
MRLFLAVELPESAINAAAAVSAALRERVRTLAPAAKLTWIPPDRMHLTISFLGEVDPPRAAMLVEVLSLPFQTVRFTVTLDGVGAFPSRGAPRVLWLGFSKGLIELQQLEREVSARLEIAGFPREQRPYSPHLTLARVREPRGLRPAVLDRIEVSSHAGGTIDAITLFESRLSPKGPTYTTLHRTLLQRA